LTSGETLKGRYYKDGSSQFEEAELINMGEALYLVPAGESKKRHVQLDRVEDRLGNVPRKIYLTGDSVFECQDNDAVDRFFKSGDTFFSRMTRAEGSWKVVFMTTIATFVCLFGIYRYGLPAMANVAVSVTPPAVVQSIDASTRASVDRILFNESKLSEERQAELTAIFEELVEISGQTNPPMTLNFRDGGRLGANAIALPGGTIILTDQLEALADNDDQIAGVLAHEIGHVEHKHSLRQLYRALGLAFMIGVIGGDSGQIVEDVVANAALLDTFAYSRAFETESDIHSVEVMIRAGRDPMAFVDLLDKILKSVNIDPQKEETGWLSSHPGNKDRRASVRSHIEAFKAQQ
jgi:predicted Zn-dependent protease